MPNRRYAREIAMQALFAVELGRQEPGEAIAALMPEKADADTRIFVKSLVFGTIENAPQCDGVITPLLREWTLDRLPAVDRTIMRMAIYELLHLPATPRAVVLNEAIELANRFCDEEAGRYINGVLDNVSVP